MALQPSEIVTLAEITRQPYSKVAALTADLIPEQEAVLSDDAGLWDEKRNKVTISLTGETNYEPMSLLREIRKRVCDMLGLPDANSKEEAVNSSGVVRNCAVF